MFLLFSKQNKSRTPVTWDYLSCQYLFLKVWSSNQSGWSRSPCHDQVRFWQLSLILPRLNSKSLRCTLQTEGHYSRAEAPINPRHSAVAFQHISVEDCFQRIHQKH